MWKEYKDSKYQEANCELLKQYLCCVKIQLHCEEALCRHTVECGEKEEPHYIHL